MGVIGALVDHGVGSESDSAYYVMERVVRVTGVIDCHGVGSESDRIPRRS